MDIKIIALLLIIYIVALCTGYSQGEHKGYMRGLEDVNKLKEKWSKYL